MFRGCDPPVFCLRVALSLHLLVSNRMYRHCQRGGFCGGWSEELYEDHPAAFPTEPLCRAAQIGSGARAHKGCNEFVSCRLWKCPSLSHRHSNRAAGHKHKVQCVNPCSLTSPGLPSVAPQRLFIQRWRGELWSPLTPRRVHLRSGYKTWPRFPTKNVVNDFPSPKLLHL